MAEYEAEIWDGLSEDNNGDLDKYIDDEDYDEGFMWTCCGEDGSSLGCRVSQHNAWVNLVVKGSIP